MFMSLVILSLTFLNIDVIASDSTKQVLNKHFNLAGERSLEEQYFLMKTKFIHYSPDGKRIKVDIYKLKLRCIPENQSPKNGYQYICNDFSVQLGEAAPVTIPALRGWSYLFKPTKSGHDEKGQVLGIEHDKFEQLTDSEGKILSPEVTYSVYNTFIDFHAFCDDFARPTLEGNGIQNLTRIGQKIIHASAYSEPSISLGNQIAEGSKFKNGEITLEFKGLSVINDKPCTLVGFDSGESSFQMKLQPLPGMNAEVRGGSHYKGDIYIDLESNWVKRVKMDELVVSEVTLPDMQQKISSVTERNLIIQSVSEQEFLNQ